MSTKAGVGYSGNSDSKKAGIEAAKAAFEQAGVTKADIAIVFTTSKHKPEQFRDGVREIIGRDCKLVGGYTIGAITNDHLSYEQYETVVTVIKSDTVKFETFLETNLPGQERAIGKRLGEKIKNGTWQGDPSVLLMYDCVQRGMGENGQPGFGMNFGTPLLQGMKEVLAKWPRMAGIGMLGDMQFNPTYQFFDDRVERQAAIAVVMHGGGVQLDSVIMHGCKPSSGYHKVTKVDGSMLLEIDDRPALEVIAELLGPDSDKSWEDYPLFITVGLNRGDKFGEFVEEDFQNRLCMAIDKEKKAMIMVEPDLKAGDEIQLMRRSIDQKYMGERAADLFSRLGAKKPFLSMYIDCSGRATAYCGIEPEEALQVQKATKEKGVPLLGVYSGVEIAAVRGEVQPLDWTGVLATFSE